MCAQKPTGLTVCPSSTIDSETNEAYIFEHGINTLQHPVGEKNKLPKKERGCHERVMR